MMGPGTLPLLLLVLGVVAPSVMTPVIVAIVLRPCWDQKEWAWVDGLSCILASPPWLSAHTDRPITDPLCVPYGMGYSPLIPAATLPLCPQLQNALDRVTRCWLVITAKLTVGRCPICVSVGAGPSE